MRPNRSERQVVGLLYAKFNGAFSTSDDIQHIDKQRHQGREACQVWHGAPLSVSAVSLSVEEIMWIRRDALLQHGWLTIL